MTRFRFATSLAIPTLALACATAKAPPDAVRMEGALDNRYLKAETPGDVIARIRIDSALLEPQTRTPVDLALVLDASGSMEGEPIANARTAAVELLKALGDDDRISVVVFHSKTEVLVPSTRVGGRRASIEAKLSKLEARGTTDLSGGLAAAIQELAKHDDGAVRRIVLLSDGVPNERMRVLQVAGQLEGLGAPVTALGLGLDFDEGLLGSIAQRTGGQFHFVEASSEVVAVFREEVLRLERVVAKNATLRLRPGPNVDVRVVGRTSQPIDRQVLVHLGDISESEPRDVILRLRVPAPRDGATVELLDAVLEFDDALGSAGRIEHALYLSAKGTDDDAEIARGKNPDVTLSAATQAAAGAALRALAEARQGNVSGANQIIADAKKAASAYRDTPAVQSALQDLDVLEKSAPNLVRRGTKRSDELESRRVHVKAQRRLY